VSQAINKISIIVTTYNSPDYLDLVLAALEKQNNKNFEVMVADDGSGPQTKALIEKYQQRGTLELIHAWHEDDGFRAAAARNHAVFLSTGDYLVFIDGDCLALPNFIDRQHECAESGYMVRGSRVMMTEAYTARVLAGEATPATVCKWWLRRFACDIERMTPLIMPFPKYRKPTAWYGVKTCNLSMWRSDFEAVNGFDERYVGWGHEDADLAVRLIRNGVKRKEGRSVVPVIHLWHQENDRSTLSDNEGRLADVMEAHYTSAILGLDQYPKTAD